MRQQLVPLALALALAGCGDATGILVEVTSADLTVGTDVDSLHFVARAENGRTINRRFPISGGWPQSLTILPSDGMDGELTISVIGLQSDGFVVRRVVRSSFDSGSTRRVQVVLSASCRGVVCAEEVDCVAGTCADLPTRDGGTPFDAGPMFDAGPDFDAGFDAGFDGGPMFDAGFDAGTDAGSDAGFDAGVDAGPPVAPLLYFTEYVEGTSNNKALEIVNEGLTDVSLSGCEILRYSNGGTSPAPIALTGTVARNDFHVVCHSSIDIATNCDQMTSSVSHNGNDAYELVCFGEVIDSFGRVGDDPGAAWAGGGITTEDHTLTRSCAVAVGDPVSTDAFDPSTEWTGAPYAGASSLAGLGSRAECP